MSFDKKELKELLDGRELKSTEDLQSLLRDLTKEVIEAVYDGELTHHLGYDKHEQNGENDNYRNGYGKKRVKSNFGEIELSPPRDRRGCFLQIRNIADCKIKIELFAQKILKFAR